MTWLIIDHQGTRPVSKEWMMRKRHQSTQGLMWGVWHSFAQVAIKANPSTLVGALEHMADAQGLKCEPVSHQPNIKIGQYPQWTLLIEPDVDLEFCIFNADSVDEFFDQTPFEGMYYGYDEDCGAVHFAHFKNGQMAFLWYDAFEPGPSFALTFHDDGSCTEEDARQYAVERLKIPDHVQQLDRFAFLEYLLKEQGIDQLDPNLSNAQDIQSFELIPANDQHGT